MKYITQIHPHSFIPSKVGSFEGIQWLNDIPIAVLDSGVYGYLTFNYFLPDDLISYNIRYTIFWVPFIIGDNVTFNINSNAHANISTVVSNLTPLWNIRKTVLEVPLTVSSPFEFISANLNSSTHVIYIQNLLVEGVT